MRIVHVVTYVSTDGAFGGPVAVMRAQTAALAAEGHEVEVFAGWDGTAQLTIPGVRVRLFPARQAVRGAGFSGIASRPLVRALAAELDRFDAVHIHFGRHLLDLQAALAVRRRRHPFVVQPHGMVQPSNAPKAILIDALATRRILRSADLVLALTADDERGLRSVARGPIRVLRVPNGSAHQDRTRGAVPRPPPSPQEGARVRRGRRPAARPRPRCTVRRRGA
jgi:glycosyltransferase involved in cell wall biosynthesis